MSITVLYREHNMSSASFYKWRTKSYGMDASMMARMRELEKENARLKRMYTNVLILNDVLQEALKKLARLSQHVEITQRAISARTRSIHKVCLTCQVNECCYRYKRKLSDESSLIAEFLLGLTQAQRNWGFGLCFHYLLNIKRCAWDHQRMYRLYREIELNLRIKPRKCLKRDKPEELSVPEYANQIWSMDFMRDQLRDERTIRLLNVIDDLNPEGLGIERLFSSSRTRGADTGANHRVVWLPARNPLHYRPEYISIRLLSWAEKRNTTIRHIQPGKPQQNAYIERCNRTVRYDWLNQ